MARLRRIDGVGDEGSRVQAIKRTGKALDKLEIIDTDRPSVGYALLVGSTTPRTYSRQNWWMTTIITEITEENEEEGYWKFRTVNSEYEFWK